MRATRKLETLQRSLMLGGDTPQSTRQAIPFLLGSRTFYLQGSEVHRVMLSNGLVRVLQAAGVPDCVVGVALCEPDVATVVDGGLLLAGLASRVTLSSRLVVLGAGEMQGFALLVDRVLDPVELGAVSQEASRVTCEALRAALEEHRARAQGKGSDDVGKLNNAGSSLPAA